MRKGIMALEGLEEVGIEEAPVVDFVDAPENDTLEMNETQNDMDSLDDQSSEAADTVETLDKMYDALGESAQDGGMSEPEAKAVEIAVEHLRARVGFSSRSKTMPAMENFADKTTRVRATKLAMESIAETRDKIVAGIISAFETVKAWAKKHYEQMQAAVGKYAQRAESLIKAGKERAKEKYTEVQVATSTFIKSLNVDGKLLAGKEFVAKYTAYVTGLFSKDANAEAAAAEECGEAIIEMIESVNDKSAYAKAKDKVAAAVAAFTGKVGEIKQGFGQMSFFTSVPKEGQVITGKDMFIKVGPSTGAVSVEGAETIASLSPEEVVQVASSAKKYFDLSKTWDAAAARIEKIQAKVSAAFNKLLGGKKDDAAAAENKAASDEAVVAGRSFMSMTSSGIASVRAYAVGVSKSALDYCGLSAKTAAPAEAAAA